MNLDNYRLYSKIIVYIPRCAAKSAIEVPRDGAPIGEGAPSLDEPGVPVYMGAGWASGTGFVGVLAQGVFFLVGLLCCPA